MTLPVQYHISRLNGFSVIHVGNDRMFIIINKTANKDVLGDC